MANLKLTETVLSSAPSALQILKMPLGDILGKLDGIEEAGYYSCEIMNRTMFYNLVKYLNEDPWQRIKEIAKHLKNTRLQVSFAGSYLWGDKIFDSSIIKFFIENLAKNSINIVRIYDPLNDISNMKAPIEIARSNNLHVQGEIIYSESEFHNIASFLTYAKKLIETGADSLCLSDPNELLNPYSTYTLISDLKKEVAAPIQFSSPNSTGVRYMNTLKAIEAGISTLDTTISPFADGASFPATETILEAFASSPYRVDMNIEKVRLIEKAFKPLREDYLNNGNLSVKNLLINSTALETHLPDDMLAYIDNITNSNEAMPFLDLIDEIVKLRDLGGTPPYTYPIYIGLVDQALINISSTHRFSQISQEFLNLVNGSYGKTPASIDPAFKDSIVSKGAAPVNEAVTLNDYKSKMPEKYNEQPEDILTLTQLPVEAPTYFETRTNMLYGIDGKYSDKKNNTHPI